MSVEEAISTGNELGIDDLLRFTTDAGASDLHLSVGSQPMVRIHGTLRRLDLPGFGKEDVKRVIWESMNDEQRKKFESGYEVDFSREIDDQTRFRVNVFRQMRGEAAVFRVIPAEIRSFEELKLPTVLKDLSLREKGLVLLTGPTGSGKTTTLATMVDWINEHKSCHIVTIEDPIEFFHNSRNSLINQRELGANTMSFSNALRAGLREDPDVILVGEMRDLETVQLALTAAETGHLVLSTLHTSGAAKTIDRIIDIFPVAQKMQVRSMLSESIEAVITQTLLPTKDGKGRVVACEVMLATVAIRNLIREDKIYQIPSIMQASGNLGMQTMDQALLARVSEGLVERAEAAKRADNPKLFMG